MLLNLNYHAKITKNRTTCNPYRFSCAHFASKSSINIGYGEAGVLFRTFGGGVVTDEPPLGEGFHIIAPWNKVYVYNVKQQEFFEGNMQVLSSNGLETFTRLYLFCMSLHMPNWGCFIKTKGENYGKH